MALASLNYPTSHTPYAFKTANTAYRAFLPQANQVTQGIGETGS